MQRCICLQVTYKPHIFFIFRCFAWVYPKSTPLCTIISSTLVLVFMIEEEEWGYLNDWEEDQLRKKRTKICMCCDHFRYACTVQCVTLLTCPVHQKLIPQGDHLIKGCKYWVKRRELREGWCPEVA